VEGELPEVTLLCDARGERPESAVGIGALWYEPEVWSLPLSPAARVLYASLCFFLARGEINRTDLRNTLKSCSDAEILGAFDELVHHTLLAVQPTCADGLAGYAVHPMRMFEG
jgi:hypothetical protein